MMAVKIKIIDRMYDPDVLYVKVSVGDSTVYERFDDKISFVYRQPLMHAIEAYALEYAKKNGYRVMGVIYE